MMTSGLDRWLHLSGLVFIGLFVVGTLPLAALGYLPDPVDVQAYFADNAARVGWLGYLGALGAAALMVFVGAVRGVISRTDRTTKTLADIGFAGGVASAVFMGLATTILATLAQRGGATMLGADAMTALADINLVGLALPVAFAIFCAGNGLALARTGTMPGWFGWASLLAAVAIGSPAGYILFTIGLAWTLVVAIRLMARSPSAAPEGA